jgi:hypothetical protein
MKIQALILANSGIPFYKVKVGQFFQHSIDSNDTTEMFGHFYDKSQVFMKVDQIGAVDYPYDFQAEDNMMFISEKAMVKVVRKTDKSYKNYIHAAEQLLNQFQEFQELVKKD